MKSFILISFLLTFIFSCAFGQEKIKDSLDHLTELEEKYRKSKDSSALLHPFIPAVSSVMLNKKQIEINFFSSLSTTNKYRDDKSDLNELEFRQTYLFNTLQFTYGISKNAKFNIGFDINSATGRIDEDRNSSMFKIFTSHTEGNSKYARAITSIAPRIRWRPLKKNYKFTIQSSFIFPTSVSAEKQNILGRSQVYFLTQFLYNQPLNKRTFLFSQLSLQYGFKNDQAPAILYSPISVYLSYFIPRKTVLFVLINYIPLLSKENNRYTFQLGGGLQYQISRLFLINCSYANDITGKNYPDFTSYNISLRFATHQHHSSH
jgi:hypothetical protein